MAKVERRVRCVFMGIGQRPEAAAFLVRRDRPMKWGWRGIGPQSVPCQHPHPSSVGGQPPRLQEARGFQTLRNPSPSKSFTFTVANVVTPWEIMVSAVRRS